MGRAKVIKDRTGNSVDRSAVDRDKHTVLERLSVGILNDDLSSYNTYVFTESLQNVTALMDDLYDAKVR